VTSALAVFETAIWVKSFLKPEKKRKHGNKRNFYIIFHQKHCFGMEFTAL